MPPKPKPKFVEPVKGALPKPPSKGDFRTLASFKTYTSRDLRIRKIEPRGPTIRGQVCVASWEILQEDSDVEAYLEVEEALGNTIRLFHGTHAINIGSIVSEGLRRGRSTGMFGGGIYFGQPEKAINYASVSSPRGTPDTRYLIEAEIALGRVYYPARSERLTESTLAEKGFHSVHARRNHTASTWGSTGYLANDEWVVYNKIQTYLMYIHEFQSVYTTESRPPPVQACQIVKTTPSPLAGGRGNSAFADLYVQHKPCGFGTRTFVDASPKGFWVCETCIKERKLKVGDQVGILEEMRSWVRRPDAGPIYVRIK